MAKKIAIILLAYAGSEMLAAGIWNKHCDRTLKTVTAGPTTTLRSVAEEALADSEVADSFVIVPAGVVPCSKIDFSELVLPKAQELSKSGQFIYSRLPIGFKKSDLVRFLADEKNDVLLDDEDFAESYIRSTGIRPMNVSFHYGNYVTPVLRAKPCEYMVIEAILTKKFISASEKGWLAIEAILKQNFKL